MSWTIAPEPFDSPAAAALWRAYYTEVSDRWYLLHEGRRTDPDELEREIAAQTWEELAPPRGQLLVGRYDGEPGGCAGVRLPPAGAAAVTGTVAAAGTVAATGAEAAVRAAELKRVFVREGLRGTGGAALLVRAAEDAARALGATRMILDTRGDLVEARALYARLGYAETDPHNDEPYADHWFARELA
jgi:GNAT superfamily N-acetyltransferase